MGRSCLVLHLSGPPFIFGLAIDGPAPFDRDVLQIDTHKDRVQPSLIRPPSVRCRQGVDGVILGRIERGARFDKKPDVATQEECAGAVIPGGNINTSSTRLGARIYSALNGLLRV